MGVLMSVQARASSLASADASARRVLVWVLVRVMALLVRVPNLAFVSARVQTVRAPHPVLIFGPKPKPRCSPPQGSQFAAMIRRVRLSGLRSAATAQVPTRIAAQFYQP